MGLFKGFWGVNGSAESPRQDVEGTERSFGGRAGDMMPELALGDAVVLHYVVHPWIAGSLDGLGSFVPFGLDHRGSFMPPKPYVTGPIISHSRRWPIILGILLQAESLATSAPNLHSFIRAWESQSADTPL